MKPRARNFARREYITQVASILFATRGYEASSMRDIAAEVGIMPASLYHHFSSKEDLLVSVVSESVAKIQRAVDAAIEDIEEPWVRFTAAILAHVEALLDREGFQVLVMLTLPPEISDTARASLISHRNEYERRFTSLLSAFNTPDGTDQRVLANLILGMLNSIPIWYKVDGGSSPREIGQNILSLVKGAFAQ
ncbi:hypothetical protein MB02_10155 [Croceicoccus estronivorus]|nr:hypothetical protein MB02_10155 [Croceicoccus estronivorus]